MKSIKFRPLRRIKKTGKITVASYMQWRKVMTADYSKFNLVIDEEHKKMAKDELVYNHKGEQLYFFNYNPADVPVFQWSELFEEGDWEKIKGNNQYGIPWKSSSHVNYSMLGADCSGVPCFSHFTSNHIADNYITRTYNKVNELEPLTVEMVLKWYGWFLWQLNNSRLSTVK